LAEAGFEITGYRLEVLGRFPEPATAGATSESPERSA
jgi:hypothetical protein